MKWEVSSKLKTNNLKLITKALLANRGIKTKKQIGEFFNPTRPDIAQGTRY